MGRIDPRKKLKDLEDDRRHIMRLRDKAEKMLKALKAGDITMSRGKQMALQKQIRDAENTSLPLLTKQILKWKREVAKMDS